LESIILTCVGGESAEQWTELLISLEMLLVVGREPLEDYDDNYVRRYAGPVRIQGADGGEPKQIGEIEVWYIDGSRAADNAFDIVDVCDSMTQGEYEYASAIYTEGSVDASIVEDPFYNDVLVIHALALTNDFRGLGLEAKIIRKIADTLGYHCAAIVFDPDRAGITDEDELELMPTKTSSLFALTDF
jgi:hypothetical protein